MTNDINDSAFRKNKMTENFGEAASVLRDS